MPTILANDPNHLIFDEPDNFASRGFPTYIGPMDLPEPRLQRAHLLRRPQPGDRQPDQRRRLCRAGRALARRAGRGPARNGLGRATERPGLVGDRVRRHAASPSLLVATSRPQLDADQVGWVYWAWKYYGDPTGSAAESLVMADGRLRSTAAVLSRAYPQAVAGTPLRFSFSPTTDVFDMAYVPEPSHPRADADLRADAAALPPRLLRPHDRRQRDVGPGERPARGAQRPTGHPRHRGGHAGAVRRRRARRRPGLRVGRMCRNITTLRGLEPVATPEEIEAAARQYVRKVSGVQKTSAETEEAFERAVTQVTKATTALIARLAAPQAAAADRAAAAPHRRQEAAAASSRRILSRTS